MKKESLTIVIILLGLLMWYSNTDLFFRLETIAGKDMTFWVKALNTILALGYSTLTAICVRHLEDYRFVKLFGAFDGIAIFLHFQANIPPSILSWVGSIFYACLMFFLVSMIWKLSDIIRKRDQKDAEEKALKKESEPKKLQIGVKEEKQYLTLNSLQGAINRGSESIEYYFNKATKEVQEEFLNKNPEVTIQ